MARSRGLKGIGIFDFRDLYLSLDGKIWVQTRPVIRWLRIALANPTSRYVDSPMGSSIYRVKSSQI